jgi:hypothetical protein
MLSPTGSNGGKHPDATLAEYCEYWGDSESVAQPQHDVPGFAKRTTHAKRRGAAVSVQQLESKP